MVDRIDKYTAALYVFLFAVPVIISLFVSQSVLSSSFALAVLYIGLSSFSFAYPAFWAFVIRRALAIRLYRKQALGVGLVSLGYAGGFLDPTGGAFYDILFLLVFYWMDASFPAVRRSDPLVRDSMRWSKLRLILWPVNLIQIPLFAYGVLGAVGYVSYDATVANTVEVFPFFATAGVGIALGVVVARRSGDPALKRNLAWFGFFVFAQFSSILIAQIDSINGLVYLIGNLVAGFSLYKSARSLVPLNRISLD